MTSPPGFLTLIPIPGPNTNELTPITTSVFIANTPENTPLTHYASTSANPNPMISPAFIEANYEVLTSLLRERRKQIHNEDLQTELEYFSEEQRERVVEFEEAPNREGDRVERNAKGGRPLEPGANRNRGQGINIPPLLAAHLERSENGLGANSILGTHSERKKSDDLTFDQVECAEKMCED
ncbi:hypothetical protein Tco_0815280, partial [Tanacetum coccineum]